MNSDSLNVVSRLGEGHMPGTFFLSEPQLKTTVYCIKWFIMQVFMYIKNSEKKILYTNLYMANIV